MTIGTENWTENPAGSPDFKEDQPEERVEESEPEEEPFTRDNFLGDLKRAARKLGQRKPSEPRD
jgi:hypothetical protein